MRFIYLIIFLLTFVLNANAQLKPAQSQYLKEVGFLVNPGFEQGYQGWTVSGTCVKSLVSDIPYLNKSLKLTCVNQNFSIKQETTDQTALSGQQGAFGLQIKVNFDGTRVTQLAGGSRTNDIRVNANPSYQRLYTIPFILNPTSNGLEVYSDINITGEIIIDNVEFGLAPDGFIAQDLDDTPVGTILAYGSETIPQGYLKADGGCYLKNGEYSQLFDVIGISGGECQAGPTPGDGFNVPDLRNEFLRGLTAGRSVFDTQLDATAVNGLVTQNDSHNHQDGNAVDTDYTNSYFRFGRGDTYTAGFGYSRLDSTSTSALTSTDTHNHALLGDTETRPQNKAVVYIIKAIGKPSKNIVAQKSLSPDKAGFIYFSAMDTEITGFLKADGSCILESAYPDFIANTGVDTFGDCQAGPTPGDGSRLPDLITNNRFVRSAGGALAVGTTQDDATAVNGLNIPSGGEHIHHLDALENYAHTMSPVTGQWGIRNFATYTPNVDTGYIKTTGSSHTHSINGDTETRPYSIALTPYIRMVDADVIRGSFEQVEEVIVEKDATNENELTAKISSSAVVLSKNYDWITSTSQLNVGEYRIDFGGLGLTTAPSVTVTPTTPCTQHFIQSLTTTNVDITTRNGAGTNNDCQFTIKISKQNTDVNKTTKNLVIKDSTLNHYNLGDCKYSILSTTDFAKLHSGNWVRMEGQSIAGSDVANQFGITTLPDAVSNGAFFRQVGGNSAGLRVFQDDLVKNHTHPIAGDDAIGGSVGVTFGTTTNPETRNTLNNSGGGVENRPKNIALNFYCLISY